MNRKRPPPAKPPKAKTAIEDVEADDDASGRIASRPDGFHWLAADGRQEFGPFETFETALADMQATDDDGASAPGESLHEAEGEIGIADWIDPDTGEPAAGQSRPHLDDE